MPFLTFPPGHCGKLWIPWLSQTLLINLRLVQSFIQSSLVDRTVMLGLNEVTLKDAPNMRLNIVCVGLFPSLQSYLLIIHINK